MRARLMLVGALPMVWCAGAFAQVGACCLNDTGACLVATQANCLGALSGTWLGTSVSCADDLPCTTTWGACCDADECVVIPEFLCGAVGEGGVFGGEGVACRETQYSESAISNALWVDMQSATPLLFADDQSGFGATDEGFATLALPADFRFDGKVYPAGTSLNVHTNGFVSLDVIDVTTRPDTFNFFVEFGPDASTPNAAICALWTDQLSASASTRTVTDESTTTLVIEWDTDPFSAQHFGGRYQMHLLSSSDPALDGAVRILYRGPSSPSVLDGVLRDDDLLFVGVHSAGGLSVFRRDVASLRSLVAGGADGIELVPVGGSGACAVNVCSADLDGNGVVDLGDFGGFGAAFGSSVGDANYNEAADLTGDGTVDLGDFGGFGAQFGRTDCLQ